MSDISIPGVSSKLNTDKMIENLMKVERIPLERLEERNALNKKQKTVWQNLNRKLTLVRDSARKLYGFQNPFDDKRVLSSDETILTATAARSASIETRNIKVIEIAKADRFSSKPMPRNEKIEAGTYTFKIGEKEISFNFRGGQIRDFAEAINRNGKDELKATVINYDRNNIYFVIESKITGADNPLNFEGKALDFATKTGIMKTSQTAARDIPITEQNLGQWTKPFDANTYTAEGNSLTLKPDKDLKIYMKPEIAAGPVTPGNIILEFNVQLKNLPQDSIPVPTPPPGPTLPEPGKATYEDITILNNPLEVSIPQWTPPPAPVNVIDMSSLYLEIGGRTEKLTDIKDNEEIQKITIPLNSISGPIASLNIRNSNTLKELTVSNIRVYNPEERGELVPVNPSSIASDAIVEIEGIQVQRSSNTIDDLIPGVTLNLKSPGSRELELNIEPDAENIKNSIIELVGNYNDLIAETHILSRNNEEIINEISYFTDAEREAALERMGALSGETSVSTIRDRMQRIMSASYAWNEDATLTMLAQIGISTNTGAPGTSGLGKLRGYLEIDEKKLDDAIANNAVQIRNIFGFDRDSDLVTDTGVAYEIDNFLRGYTETGGIISVKIGTIERNITRTDTEITNYERKLVRTEADLRKKYGAMEGALSEMEKTSASLQNLNSNNNSR